MITSPFPEFPEKNALKNGYSWTARYHSYNQRKEDIYYVISIHLDGNIMKEFGVVINYTEDENIFSHLDRLASKMKTNIPPHVFWKSIGSFGSGRRIT